MTKITAVLLVLLLGLCAMAPTILAATNKPPVAEAGPDKQAAPGDTVYFDGSGSYDPDGQAINYSWDFDDTNGIQPDATGAMVSHVYPDEGVFTVTLTVADDNGTGTDTCKVTVTQDHVNQAPTAVITEPANNAIFNTTVNITFSGNGSSDPDGDLLTYKWDFGDNAHANGMNVKHQYKSAGIYTVILNVSDGQLSNEASITLFVEGTPSGPPAPPPVNPPGVPSRPWVDPGGPYEGYMANEEVQLDGSRSKSTDAQPLEFCWDLNARNGIQAQWCFDAAAAKAHYVDIAYGYSPVVAWKTPGNYTVTLMVREATAKKNVPFNFYNVTTFNILITEHMTFNVDAGKDRTISSGAKTSLMGAVHIKDQFKWNDERVVECGWDFTNDGSIDYKQSFDPSENAKTPSCPAVHTYNVNGTVKNDTIFTARLQAEVDGVLHLIPASDNDEVKVDFNSFYNDTVNLTVPAPPDIPPVVTCGPDKTGNNAAFVGEETKFTAVASDPDDDRIINFEWDFDGNGIIDSSNPASGDATFTYTAPGSYVASVNVTDYRKAFTICSLNVTVLSNSAPLAVINSPDQAKAGDEVTFDASDSTDPNGANEIVSYSWDFDARDGIGSDMTGKTVNHIFTKGATYSVTLTVTDKHDAPGTATADIKIIQTYDVKVESTGPTSAEVAPGSSQVFSLKVTNAGDGDDCFDLDKSGTKTTWADLSVNQVCMKSGEAKSVNLRVTVPAATPASDTATITVGATSQGSAEAKDNVQIRVTSKQSFGVGLHMDEASSTMKAGDAKTVSIRITNLGNGKDTIKFSTDGPDKAWFDFKSDSVALDSGETKETTVTILVPSNAKGGDHPVTITAYSIGDNSQKISVLYTVTVQEKASKGFIPGFDPVMVLLALAVAFIAVGAWKKRKQQS